MTPFTYLIGWTAEDMWYYGVKFSVGCEPSDLWTTYFTSSKIVKEMRRLHGEPDVVQVRKTFADPRSARGWEFRVLRRMRVRGNGKWLNQSNHTDKFYSCVKTEEHRSKIAAGRLGKRHSEEAKAMMSAKAKARPFRALGPMSEETKEKIRQAKLNQPFKTRRPMSEETKAKISATKRRKYLKLEGVK